MGEETGRWGNRQYDWLRYRKTLRREKKRLGTRRQGNKKKFWRVGRQMKAETEKERKMCISGYGGKTRSCMEKGKVERWRREGEGRSYVEGGIRWRWGGRQGAVGRKEVWEGPARHRSSENTSTYIHQGSGGSSAHMTCIVNHRHPSRAGDGKGYMGRRGGIAGWEGSVGG